MDLLNTETASPIDRVWECVEYVSIMSEAYLKSCVGFILGV